MVWDSKAFGEAISKPGVDGCILTFTIPMERNDTKWSYAKVDENGIVTECAEKVVISDHASVGLYYWTRGDQYCKYAKQMIEKGIRHKGVRAAHPPCSLHCTTVETWRRLTRDLRIRPGYAM